MAENEKNKVEYNAKDIAESQLKEFTKKHSSDEFEGYIAKKYFVLCEKLLSKGSMYIKIVNVLKAVSIAAFLLFTVFALYMGHSHGSKMLWLSIWIVFIFLLVFVFLVLDYFRNVFLKNLICFLENAEETEFKEIDFDYLTDIEEDEDENDSENI